jgi:hypothetical protein
MLWSLVTQPSCSPRPHFRGEGRGMAKTYVVTRCSPIRFPRRVSTNLSRRDRNNVTVSLGLAPPDRPGTNLVNLLGQSKSTKSTISPSSFALFQRVVWHTYSRIVRDADVCSGPPNRAKGGVSLSKLNPFRVSSFHPLELRADLWFSKLSPNLPIYLTPFDSLSTC